MEEKKKSRLPVFLIVVFILVLAALYVYLYILPDIDDSRIQSVIVRYAQVQEQAQAKCIVARDETVFTSGGAGSVSYYIDEGSKTRRGTKIADVYGTSRVSITAPSTGTVSYYLDGLEEELSPSAFSQLDVDKIASMSKTEPKSEKHSEVTKDEPIFKLIKSDTWYVLIIIGEDQKDVYTQGQSITVRFEDGADLPAKIDSVLEGSKNRIAVASISRYYEKFAQLRSVDCTIVTSVTDGLLIPTTAITTNGENVGVYVLGLDGNYSFKAIEILIEGDTDTLIADGGPVKLYDEVLKDARDH